VIERTQSGAMIRRPRPDEIKLLPQIENEPTGATCASAWSASSACRRHR